MNLRYAAAKLEEHQKAEAYRYYCTTALKCIADNTRAMCGGGSAPEKSFWDIMHDSTPAKAEREKDSDEIISELTIGAGLTMID